MSSGEPDDATQAVSAHDLLRWSESLSAIARTGLGFTQSLYEQERFEEVLKVAADIRVAAGHELEAEVLVEEWLKLVGEGVAGYVTPKVAVKEVLEETGIEIEPLRLIAVLDGLRLGFTRVPLYSLVFHCRALGGELKAHPLETAGVGWFAEDALPWPLAGAERWGPHAFRALRGEHVDVLFDAPRAPMWRSDG